jgi:predicted acylesterase/phospholipase RssA
MAKISLISALALVLVAGCTSVNEPLNPPETPVDQRVTNHTRATILREPPAAPDGRSDNWFVGVAISGGGLRSSNFSAAVMFELQRLGLLSKVDAISSVSGGSITAAYYCLNDDRHWNPGNLQRLMTHRFASDMWCRLIQPWIFAALMFTDYDRSDLLAETLNQNVFSRDGRSLTFADLRPDRPRLLINATDLQSGNRFVFTNEHFDAINSDLAKYPIGYACAASSSVPVVLHQVTLRDFSTTFTQYRHFVDGGIVDNLGLLTLLETYKSNNDRAVKEHRAPPYGKGAVLVIIDAGTQFNARLSDRGDVGLIEGLGTGAKLSSAKLLNRASSATLADMIVQYAPGDLTAEDIRKLLKTLEEVGYVETRDRDGRPLTIVHIALSRAAGLKNAPFTNFALSLDEIDTYFNISESDAYHLYRAADLIVKERFEDKLVQLREKVSN